METSFTSPVLTCDHGIGTIAAIRFVRHVPQTWLTMTNDTRALSTLSTSDYEAIEMAVMETARGRWFLKEYASRNRTADTQVLLTAIGRLEQAVTGERAMEQVERVRFDLLEMAKSIAGLKLELTHGDIVGSEQSYIGDATTALDGIVRTTEQATSNILEAAEAIQEIAWSLREQQYDEGICDRIDRLATDIYTSCGFQDLTAQRTQKVVRTLRFLEGRINALIDAWSPREGEEQRTAATANPAPAEMIEPLLLENPPQLTQSDVDIVIVDEEVAPSAPSWTDFTESPDLMVEAKTGNNAAELPAEAHDRDAYGGMTASMQTQPDPAAAAIEAGLSPDLMASDDEPMIIDDVETVEIDFVPTDEASTDMALASDTAEHVRSRPAVDAAMASDDRELDVPQPSLAQIDAMPTTAKAQIFS
jgi:chemotaxis regulatin CheY-phosphate phosphatase CheZ